MPLRVFRVFALSSSYHDLQSCSQEYHDLCTNTALKLLPPHSHQPQKSKNLQTYLNNAMPETGTSCVELLVLTHGIVYICQRTRQICFMIISCLQKHDVSAFIQSGATQTNTSCKFLSLEGGQRREPAKAQC